MLLIFDIGNTHTHAGLANDRRVLRQINLPTAWWDSNKAAKCLERFVGSRRLSGAVFSSVVPGLNGRVRSFLKRIGNPRLLELNAKTVRGVGVRYPAPATIGSDRLANAVAARHFFGAPVVVVDFGTAVTFDVVDRKGNYVGGIIAPGLAAMTDYLHEKTALLPKIKIREVRGVVGKNTRQAMLIGAVHGYRGLIRELLRNLKKQLAVRRLPVVATGGYATLMARGMPEIKTVDPLLTLEGLRLVWRAHRKPEE